MTTPTKEAMSRLKNNMTEMRYQAGNEIWDEIETNASTCANYINDRYSITDKKTGQPVVVSSRELVECGTWHHHEMTTILKRFEDDAFEQMTWAVEAEESENTIYGHLNNASTVEWTSAPVGRDEFIAEIEKLGKSSLAQEAILHRAFKYLQTIPDVTCQEAAVQEVQSIAKVKHCIDSEWVAEGNRAFNIYLLMMKGRGQGFDRRNTNEL
ncbi:hypothetical protein N0V94_006353 [Neodidymelliopsis sp. IMI 364377]|nr:hypothetical protein N0V94_006353 [Neodidymelliopsis sp. IMI 364377]